VILDLAPSPWTDAKQLTAVPLACPSGGSRTVHRGDSREVQMTLADSEQDLRVDVLKVPDHSNVLNSDGRRRHRDRGAT